MTDVIQPVPKCMHLWILNQTEDKYVNWQITFTEKIGIDYKQIWYKLGTILRLIRGYVHDIIIQAVQAVDNIIIIVIISILVFYVCTYIDS